jgi:uncharacterized protein YecE (DUF72 family)
MEELHADAGNVYGFDDASPFNVARQGRPMVTIGTAGWALPKEAQERFPAEGSHLTRYAAVFNGTEINSSFHRQHRMSTYRRWAAGVPDGFRFSVKVPKWITHVQRLVSVDDALDAFIEETAALGEHLACVLVQLPPSLEFKSAEAELFLEAVRRRYSGDVAIEPRHESWFAPACAHVLEQYRISRVAADPPRVPEAAEPAAWGGLAYWRLHGSPDIYRSSYSDTRLTELAARIERAQRSARNVWCIFDNTASSAATPNALALQALIARAIGPRRQNPR